MFENGTTEIVSEGIQSSKSDNCDISVLSDRLKSENCVPFPPSILVNNELNSECERIQTKNKKQKFTRRQWFLVAAILYGSCCTGAAYSLIAPFFPKEAEEKGVTPTQYGFVFSLYEIGCFLFCPIFGKMIPHLTVKFFIIIGLFIGSYCSIVFSLLSWSRPGNTFLTLALVVRLMWSIGGAAFFTGSYTAITVYFPNSLGTMIATTEMASGLGLLAGPTLGGILYEIGGFHFPFIFMGIFIAISLIPLALILPDKHIDKKDESSCGVLQLLSHFGVSLNILVNIVCCVLFGFNEATLEHHLREFSSLSASQTGLIFLACALMYATSSQIWGYISDRMRNPQILCIYGLMLSIISFAIVGPMYGLPFEPSVPLAIFAQILFGIAMGGQVVGSFSAGLKEVDKSNLPKSVGTSALVSSVYAASFAFGTSIGPAIGGVMIDHIGYRITCIPIICIQVLMILLIVVYMIQRRK